MDTFVKRSWLTLGVIGLLSLSVMAAPPPESGKIPAGDLASGARALEGKVIRVSFNRISYMHKATDDLYAGELRSRSIPKLEGSVSYFYDEPGVLVTFPVEGYGLLSKFIPEVGKGDTDVKALGNVDNGDVYVLMGSPRSIALGDRYKDGAYEWSKKTVLPDLTDAKKVSVSELFLFPEQVNGRTLQLEFYYAEDFNRGSEQRTVNVSSSYLGGHMPVPIEVPPEGVEFFDEALSQSKSSLKAQTVIVHVEASPGRKVTVKALGRRQQGKGDEATYKW